VLCFYSFCRPYSLVIRKAHIAMIIDAVGAEAFACMPRLCES
jgi:hypothetical protein